MKIAFVNPSSYGISLNQSLPNGTRIDSAGRNTSRITYATISGQYSATTQVMHIPFPYWELWYTVEPAGKMGGMIRNWVLQPFMVMREAGYPIPLCRDHFP